MAEGEIDPEFDITSEEGLRNMKQSIDDDKVHFSIKDYESDKAYFSRIKNSRFGRYWKLVVNHLYPNRFKEYGFEYVRLKNVGENDDNGDGGITDYYINLQSKIVDVYPEFDIEDYGVSIRRQTFQNIFQPYIDKIID